jgi:hypothetical protein
MPEQVYKKREDAERILASNAQTQQAAAQQKETQSRLSQLRPVVRSTNDQLQIKTQMIVVETFKALEKGIPAGSSLRTLLG